MACVNIEVTLHGVDCVSLVSCIDHLLLPYLTHQTAWENRSLESSPWTLPWKQPCFPVAQWPWAISRPVWRSEWMLCGVRWNDLNFIHSWCNWCGFDPLYFKVFGGRCSCVRIGYWWLGWCLYIYLRLGVKMMGSALEKGVLAFGPCHSWLMLHQPNLGRQMARCFLAAGSRASGPWDHRNRRRKEEALMELGWHQSTLHIWKWTSRI